MSALQPIDDIVGEYLTRADRVLKERGASTARRREIVADLAEHIASARAEEPEESVATIRQLLERLGRPEDIATLGDASDRDPGTGRARRAWWVAAAAGAVAAVLLAVVPGGTPRSVNRGSPATSTTSGPATPTTSGAATPTTSSTTGTASIGTGTPPRSGTYGDGPAGTPHYFVVISPPTGGTFRASLQYVYQDGQTSVVATFTGSWVGGIATLDPISVPQDGSASQDPSTLPSSISAAYDATSIQLGECTSYMHFAGSMADCRFAYGSIDT